MIDSTGLRSSAIRQVMVLAVCLVASGSGAAESEGAEPAQTSADTKPRPLGRAAAWIKATPNPVPGESGQGTTTISWDAGDQPTAQVYLLVVGKPEQLFAGGRRGSQEVAWIRKGGTYRFLLYAGTEHKLELGRVAVTHASSVGRGEVPFLKASPNPARMSTTTIEWSVGDRPDGRVVMSCDGDAEKLFAGGKAGSRKVNWIRPGSSYEFTLYSGAEGGDRLACVTIHEYLDVLGSIYFVLKHHMYILSIMLVCYLVGLRLTINNVCGSLGEEICVCITLGLGVLAYAVFLLGVAGLLYPATALAALVGLTAASYAAWPGLVRRMIISIRSLRSAGLAKVMVGVVLLTPLAVLPLYPPTDFDSILYHLPYAKGYVKNHGLGFMPYLRFPVFPQMNEMLFTLDLLLFDDVTAQLSQFYMFLLVALAVYAWGRRHFSTRTGLWGAAVWLGNPIALRLGASASIEIGVTLFVTMAMYSLSIWLRTRDRRWLLLAGVFTGYALGSKYLPLFFFAAAALTVLYQGVRSKKIRELAIYVSLSVVVCSPWYVRNYYHTGNPVFPFFASVFGRSEWDPNESMKDPDLENRRPAEPAPEAASLADRASSLSRALVFLPWQAVHSILRGAAKSPELLLLPWRLAFDWQFFGGKRTLAPFSPVYLFALPVLVIAMVKDSRVRGLLCLVVVYVFFWSSNVPDPRYLSYVLPLLSLVTAAGAERALGYLTPIRSPERVSSAVTTAVGFAVLSAPGLWYAGSSIRWLGPLPLNQEARDFYLAEKLKSYQAYSYLKNLNGDDYKVYSLFDELMSYYSSGTLMGDWFGPARYARLVPLTYMEELANLGGKKGTVRLKSARSIDGVIKSLGADYFLVTDRICDVELPEDDFFKSKFKLTYQKSGVKIYKYLNQSEGRRLASPAKSIAGSRTDAESPGSDEREYGLLIERIGKDVRRVVPPDASVLVVSTGDDALLALEGRKGAHFPQADDGVYAGFNPADGAEAISHLESLRARGAGFLLFPNPAFWWLDFYADFRRHLDRNYQRIWDDSDCRIYKLQRKEGEEKLENVGLFAHPRP